MPEVQRYDLIVIGSGPAGRRAAIQAAKLNRSVLVVDRGRRIGGVSVHTGTIPSKTLRETVLNLSGWRERSFYGLAYRVKKEISAADLLKRLHITLNHEVEVLEHQFARNGVMTLRGDGALRLARGDRGDRRSRRDHALRRRPLHPRGRAPGRTGPSTCRSTATACWTATRSSISSACRAT